MVWVGNLCTVRFVNFEGLKFHGLAENNDHILQHTSTGRTYINLAGHMKFTKINTRMVLYFIPVESGITLAQEFQWLFTAQSQKQQ